MQFYLSEPRVCAHLLLKQLAIIVSRKISHGARIALSINFAIRALSVFIYLSQANKGAPLCAASNLMLRAAADMQHQFALFCGSACVAFRLFTFLDARGSRISATIEPNPFASLDLFPMSFVSGKYSVASVSFFPHLRAAGALSFVRSGLEHALLCKSAPKSKAMRVLGTWRICSGKI
jgi:hypothetical protein